MKKFTSGLVGRKGSKSSEPSYSSVTHPAGNRSLETVIGETIIAFSESGNPNRQRSPDDKDETVYLSEIVEAAEASPGAARKAANTIRDVLDKKAKSKPYAKYNVIMLIEILGKNPGKTFTDSFDDKFVDAVKHTLRTEQDVSVQESLRHTLDWLASDKSNEKAVRSLVDMWMREKSSNSRPRSQIPQGYGYGQPQQLPYQLPRQHSNSRNLPSPDELASRIEEATSTAKLLRQTVRATRQEELSTDGLIQELAERVQAATKSMMSYCNSTSPYPDNETFTTMIKCYELLNIATSEHWRAILEARKRFGDPSRPPSTQVAGGLGQELPTPQQNGQTIPPPISSGYGAPPPGPPPRDPARLSMSQNNSAPITQDPFLDHPTQEQQQPPRQNYSLFNNTPFPSDSGGQQQQQQQQQYPPSNLPEPLHPQQVQSQPQQEFQQQADPSAPAVPMNSRPPPTSGSPDMQGSRYNENWRPSQSYMGRQDSAVNNVTMHGA